MKTLHFKGEDIALFSVVLFLLHLLWVYKIGAPNRIRTCDLSLRRGSRYPAVPPGLLISLFDYTVFLRVVSSWHEQKTLIKT